MKNVLVLGATGQIAQWAIDTLQNQADVADTFVRNKSKLKNVSSNNTRIIEGDVLNVSN